MDITIWEQIASTSWWYYVCFGVLIWLSLHITKPRLVSFKASFLYACFFFGAGSFAYFASQPQTLMNFTLLLIALGLGVSLGWLEFHLLLGVQAIKEKALLRLPGTWLLFILLLLGISAKIYFNFSISIYLDLFKNPEMSPYVSLIFGTVAGLFFGRVLYGRYCLKYGPFVIDQKPTH